MHRFKFLCFSLVIVVFSTMHSVGYAEDEKKQVDKKEDLVQNTGKEEPNTGNPNNDSTSVENINISGIVVDDDSEPLPGVTVVTVDNTAKGIATDTDGRFLLDDVPSNTNIKFSYVGYTTQTVPAVNFYNNGEYTVVLTADHKDLDEVTAIACSLEGNVATAKKINGVCKPTQCKEGFVLWNETTENLNNDGGSCDAQNIDDCQSVTYGDACVQKTDADIDQENAVADESNAEPQMSKEEREKLIAEKEQALKAAKEKETSTANKALGAASMAASGIGAMELASAIAEKRADENAEADMTAYLATFRCDYGDGKSFKGGETEIQLPGGNALIEYYGEYMRLANDLKIRKQALGMKPGIESEVVLDASQLGLYDDETRERGEGAFTSIYRALTNLDGTDAKKWDEQKSATKTKRNVGIGLTATGVVGGAVGDMIINREKTDTDEKTDKKSDTGLNLKNMFENAADNIGVTKITN
ncbi:MAG: carboxypeptidase-like regulatory domain-containing protein [Alphaproteobacteria bacterium]|nr:carboxypeptidase-like regulatory domain-containing protein [Alphaproteobacteria bacterium]